MITQILSSQCSGLICDVIFSPDHPKQSRSWELFPIILCYLFFFIWNYPISLFILYFLSCTLDFKLLEGKSYFVHCFIPVPKRVMAHSRYLIHLPMCYIWQGGRGTWLTPPEKCCLHGTSAYSRFLSMLWFQMHITHIKDLKTGENKESSIFVIIVTWTVS